MFEDVFEGMLLDGFEGAAMTGVVLGDSSGVIAGGCRNWWSSVLMRV